jgi:hypothetical protein
VTGARQGQEDRQNGSGQVSHEIFPFLLCFYFLAGLPHGLWRPGIIDIGSQLLHSTITRSFHETYTASMSIIVMVPGDIFQCNVFFPWWEWEIFFKLAYSVGLFLRTLCHSCAFVRLSFGKKIKQVLGPVFGSSVMI